MRKRLIEYISLLGMAAILLSACSGLIGVEQATDTPVANPAEGGRANDSQPGQPAPVEPQPAEGDSAPAAADVPAGSENGEEASAALPPRPELGFSPGATQLEASDPSQVVLASGELKLVELFAFW